MRHWNAAPRQREHYDVIATFEMLQPSGQDRTSVPAVFVPLMCLGVQSHWPVLPKLENSASRVPPDGTLVAHFSLLSGDHHGRTAAVAHAGIVRFEPADDGRTRVHIRMSYNPPGGWIGHGVAAAFGADPKRSLDADLVRMKTLIETGRPPHDAAQPDVRSDQTLPM